MTALANRKHTLLDVLTILLLTLVISALLIVACGASPVEAAGLFVKGIFGTKSSFAEIFVKACPLIPVSYTHLDVYKRQCLLQRDMI